MLYVRINFKQRYISIYLVNILFIPSPILTSLFSILSTNLALRLFLVFLLKSPVFFKVSPAYLEELLIFLVSSETFSLSWRSLDLPGVLLCLLMGSKAFSGVSPPIPGVLYSFTSLFRRTPYFPGVSLNLLVFLVFTRFYWSSPLFAGVPYLNHQIFFKLHQLFLKLPITFIAMLDASMVAPYFQCYD